MMYKYYAFDTAWLYVYMRCVCVCAYFGSNLESVDLWTPLTFEPKAVRISGTDALVVEELYFMFFKKANEKEEERIAGEVNDLLLAGEAAAWTITWI